MANIPAETIIREFSAPFKSRGLWGLRAKKKEQRKTHQWKIEPNHTVCLNCGIFKLNDRVNKFCKEPKL